MPVHPVLQTTLPAKPARFDILHCAALYRNVLACCTATVLADGCRSAASAAKQASEAASGAASGAKQAVPCCLLCNHWCMLLAECLPVFLPVFKIGTPKEDGLTSVCLCMQYAGIIISPIAVLFMLYALFMYKQRTVQILRRANVRYDDQRGPVMLVILLMAATLASLVLTAYGTLR